MSKITIIEGNSNSKDDERLLFLKGEKGADGVSPTASISKEGDVATITVTDAEGTTSTTLKDGYNPTITATESTGKVVIDIDDIEGQASTTISDPVIGITEETGKVTLSVTDKTNTRTTVISDPVVTATKSNGIATISVTDKSGTSSTTVADGADLTDGAVPTGAVIGFDGNLANIPGGFEIVNNRFNLSSYLENSWSNNGQCMGKFDDDGYKHINVSCRNGNNTQIMTLPSQLWPTETILLPATNGSSGGYVMILVDGTVSVSSNIYSAGSGNVIFVGSYQ